MQATRPSVAVFQEAEIVNAITLDEQLVTTISNAFACLSHGGVCMPPPMQLMALHYNGQTCIKGALIPGLDFFAVKLSSIYPRHPDATAAESNGMFALIECATGRVRACLLDNGYLTQLRTAAAGALAAKYLAPTCVETIGIIGAGKQALWQIRAAYLVRPFKRAIIWSRRVEQSNLLAEQVQSLLPISVTVATTVEQAVSPAQLVVTTTASRTPLLTDSNLHPNLHITAMGSDAKGKRELSDALLRNVDIYIADDLDACRLHGELQTLREAELALVTTLGDVISGKEPGRTSDHQMTVSDLTGVGAQDTAIAVEAFQRLLGRNQVN